MSEAPDQLVGGLFITRTLEVSSTVRSRADNHLDAGCA